MVYHIGPGLPLSQTNKPKLTSRRVSADVAVADAPETVSSGVERRKRKDRRRENRKVLVDMRSGRDRRKNSGKPGGLEVEA